MNKITKIGLTALAGSLVATSAFAGAMSVSGSAKVTYTGGKGNSAANPFSNSKGITFSGSGEMDNGFTVSTGYTMSDAAFSTSHVSLDMGDSGTLSFMNNTSTAGLNKYQDMMPTAGEQVWDDVDTDDNGVVGHGNLNAFGYEVEMMGVTASASYQKDGIGSNSSIVLIANDLGAEGLQIGAGLGTNATAHDVEDDHSTIWAVYTAGMATVGIQKSVIDANSADEDRLAYSASLAVNENLSVSYGISTVDFETAGLSDEESAGLSASYTMGGVTIAGVFNSTDAVAGVAATDKEFKEISVAFAF
jgi:outer membrane protein OmpU